MPQPRGEGRAASGVVSGNPLYAQNQRLFLQIVRPFGKERISGHGESGARKLNRFHVTHRFGCVLQYGLGILRQGDTKTKPTNPFRAVSGSGTVYQGEAS
jgi:hypothetical protein